VTVPSNRCCETKCFLQLKHFGTIQAVHCQQAFKSGREFAAWPGLVAGQTESSGTIRLQGISKRGYTYLRTLLVHSASSIIYRARQPGQWVEQIKQRRPCRLKV
jgi:transposase